LIEELQRFLILTQGIVDPTNIVERGGFTGAIAHRTLDW
jgi:hypothetical protein